MKKILFLLFALALLTSCEKDPVTDKGKLDPNAMILIKPAKGVQLKATVPGLNGLEVVQQAVSLKLQTRYFDDQDVGEMRSGARMFNEETMKDFDTPALLMLGIDVINAQGKYIRDFTHSKNVVITNIDGDTIAYVPDDVINSARLLIEAAYNDENYTEVYRLFNEAFTFLPISE
ncbi:lipoprotein [Proteiniphilum acetatigenes]|uniref:lipoprotein n=1 Tax=Proteiniphilum acetatigenes TaxID=294710 RepID=UPI00037B45C9|nr:lipoprotein [Proteiniphilum acetatigenes]